MAEAKRDQNRIPTLLGVSVADGVTPVPIYADPTTHRLYVDLAIGSGTVTNVSVATANGVSGTVTSPTVNPEITLVLGDITPDSVNGIVLSGSSTPELSVTGTAAVSNSNTGDQDLSGLVPKTTTVNGHALSGNVSVTATDVSLGNVTNESKATMFTDPTFTGTVSGVTATMVGLGNVTNESKATMFTNPTFTGHATVESVTATGATGTGKFVFDGSPVLVTPTIGVATATSVNKVTITAPAASATLTIANTKTLTASNTLTLAGTDGTTITFQATDTYVGRATTDTLTNKRITARIGTEASSATTAINSDLYDQWNITALAEADVIGAPSGTPTDGQTLMIRIKDNGTARALSFNSVFRASSDLTLPTTTVLSKTLYLGFRWNAADSKWDYLAGLNNF